MLVIENWKVVLSVVIEKRKKWGLGIENQVEEDGTLRGK